jgi:hypothetical protein
MSNIGVCFFFARVLYVIGSRPQFNVLFSMNLRHPQFSHTTFFTTTARPCTLHLDDGVSLSFSIDPAGTPMPLTRPATTFRQMLSHRTRRRATHLKPSAASRRRCHLLT